MPKQPTTKPVPASPQFTNNTYRDAGTRYNPFGQDARDQSLLAMDKTTNQIVRSVDDGLTYQPFCDFVFRGNLNEISYLPNGEILVGMVGNGTTGMSVWRSTGWATPKTATFTETFALPGGLTFAYGGWSVHGWTVLVSEYGPQTDKAAAEGNPAATRAYLSRDGGETFTQVFDLSTDIVEGETEPWGSPDTVQHLHGCAYDALWDRIWLPLGDAGGVSVCGIIYSDDEGATWHAYPDSVETVGHWQSVLPDALDNGIVFASDFDANGLRRIGRSGYRQGAPYGAAHIIDHERSIQIIGRSKYQAPGVRDAPHLYSFCGVGADYPGAVAATFDGGTTFHTLYKDDLHTGSGMAYMGVQKCFGPTNTGRYVTVFNDTARFANGAIMVSELVAPKQQAEVASTGAPIIDELFVGGAEMYGSRGTVSMSEATSMYGFPSWRMANGEICEVSTMVNPPAGWETYSVTAIYSNVANVSGDVVWRMNQKELELIGSQYFPTPGNNMVEPISTNIGITNGLVMATGVAANPGKVRVLVVQRRGGEVADTLPGDIYLHGLLLTRET